MDDGTAKIVKPAPGTVIDSSERAAALVARKQEKAQEELQRRWVETHNSVMPSQVKDSPEAFGAAVIAVILGIL